MRAIKLMASNKVFPLAAMGITLQEIPDKIAVYFEMGNCINKCKNCHSPHLWQKIRIKTSIQMICTSAANEVNKGANAILLLGGTTNDILTDDLILLINKLDKIAPVGLYSGSDDEELNNFIGLNSCLTWLKTGSYQPDKGSLQDANTNQKFYRKEFIHVIKNGLLIEDKPFFVDHTKLFCYDKKKTNE